MKLVKYNHTDNFITTLNFKTLKYFKLLLLMCILYSGITFTPPVYGQQESSELNVVPVTSDPAQDMIKRLLSGEPIIDTSANTKLTIEEVKAVTLLSPGVANAVRALPGCTTNTLPRNDDLSTGIISLPFAINFFGRNFSQVYVNNNGNITFTEPLRTYTPFGLTGAATPIIAPFFADVDTGNIASGVVQYGNTIVDGRSAFCVNYVNVGYFSQKADKLNSFQVILIDRTNTGTGNFDIEFNYNRIQWETGDLSGGTGGLGGDSARAGYANGNTTPGTFFELPGSGVNGGLLDTNSSTGLTNNSLNSGGTPGRYTFSARNGTIVPCSYSFNPTSAPNIAAAGGNGSFTVTNTAGTTCSWAAQSNATWLTTSSASSTGNGTVNYTVTANNTTSSRTGTINIGGQLFTVTQAAAAATCVIVPINIGQSINGSLTSSSCQVNQRPTDLYTFTGTAGQSIVASLDSAGTSGIQPSLQLISPDGVTVLAQESGSTNARIPATGFFQLPFSGTYTIRVSTLDNLGDYTLSLSQQPTITCAYTLSPTSTDVIPAGGTYFFDVLTGDGCPTVSAAVGVNSGHIQIVSNSGGRVTFRVTSNDNLTDRTETIVVAGQTHTVRQFGVSSPPNDLFAQAVTLPVIDPGNIQGRNTNATAETGEPIHAGSTARRSVWYKWTAPGNGLYSFTTSGSSFDTVMAIYTGSSVNNLTRIAENDDTTNFDSTSKINFNATAGVEYKIAIDGKNDSGSIRLSYAPFRRLFRLYLQNFNGFSSTIIPSTVSAKRQDGTGPTINGTAISLGVYEFDLPIDNAVYQVTISGPSGITWQPSVYTINNSSAAYNELMEGDSQSGGQNQTSNATNTIPRRFKGFIDGISTTQELSALRVQIASSGSNSAVAPLDCNDENPLTLVSGGPNGTMRVRYDCKTEPGTTHQIRPSAPNKSFTVSILQLSGPVDKDTGPASANAITASNAQTFNLKGKILANGQGLSGVTIDISSDAMTDRMTSDASGNYVFANLNPGTVYTLKASRKGFVFQTQTVILQPPGTNLDFTAQTCAYSFSGNGNIDANGGSRNVAVTAITSQTCEWTATNGSNSDWIRITPNSTVGNGLVLFNVDPNNGAARSGSIVVGGQSFTVQQQGNNNPVPSISSFEPNNITVGSGAFTLTVNGSNFVSGSVVRWNGQDKNTTFVNANRITAQIPASDIATARQVPLTVFNPTPGGGLSNASNFSIDTCTYQVVQPAQGVFNANGGQGSFLVDINGSGCPVTATTDNYCMLSLTTTGQVVSYSVFPNTGVGRSATITVGGQTIVINQDPAAGSHRAAYDFDGDGKADIAVFRPSNGTWYLNLSQGGTLGVGFGQSGDRLVAADYDGDGLTDLAVYRNGIWYIQRTSLGFFSYAFGDGNDIPQPADFDGDGKSELVVFRPSNGTWYTFNLASGENTAFGFGQSGDKPVVGDYDGDGKADYAVYRSGIWYLQRSRDGFLGYAFGAADDKPVQADYDGDGKTDITVYRPANGVWYQQQSSSGFASYAFGNSTDLPVPADYNGDGRADIAVYRPAEGNWYIWSCTANARFAATRFGAATDLPVQNAFVP